MSDAVPGLRLDEVTHTYYKDGVPVPSATQCLQRAGLVDFSRLPADVRELALDRGRKVHRAAQLLIAKRLDYDKLDERLKGYVDGAAAFLSSQEFIVQQAERLVYHPAYRYAGTADLIGLWQCERAVADYCTGDLADSAKDLQTSGYAEALRVNRPACWLASADDDPILRVGVRLFKDGTYKLQQYKDPIDFRRFTAAVVVTHEQLRRGLSGVAA